MRVQAAAANDWQAVAAHLFKVRLDCSLALVQAVVPVEI